MPGVSNPAQARADWMVYCQGCHTPEGRTQPRNAPPLAGHIARFLSAPGGREYLGRVPGVATAALPDDRLAELLNWTLLRYDAEHVPASFQPYTTAEMHRLRARPLRADAPAMRAQLLSQIQQ